MNARTLYTLTAILIATFGLLFIIRFAQMINDSSGHTYISPNDVRGSAIHHHGTLYTLSFEQQNNLLASLNNAQAARSSDVDTMSDIKEIVIYRFEGEPDIIITPLGFVGDQLLFNAPMWHRDGPLIETSGGALKELLIQAYE